jgi:hypothetical protein
LQFVAPGSNPWSCCIQENNLAECHYHLQSRQLQLLELEYGNAQ